MAYRGILHWRSVFLLKKYGRKFWGSVYEPDLALIARFRFRSLVRVSYANTDTDFITFRKGQSVKERLRFGCVVQEHNWTSHYYASKTH